jgi:hypothetical protein
MTIAQKVGRVVANTEAAVNDFVSAVRYLMIEPRGGADRLAEQERAPSRVVDFTKAATAAGSTVAAAEKTVEQLSCPPTNHGTAPNAGR